MAQDNSTSPNSGPSDGRRSSIERFANLHSMKRTSNPDAFQQRRSSLSDQTKTKPGFLGQMWQNYTRGAMSSEKK